MFEKITVLLDCPTVSSEEFVAVNDDHQRTASIMADKDILSLFKAQKVSLIQIPTTKRKLIVQLLLPHVIQNEEHHENCRLEDDDPDEGRTVGSFPNLAHGNPKMKLREIKQQPTIYGPHRFPSHVLQSVVAVANENVWLMYDGVPTHFSIPVRNHLHDTYFGRWIRRDGPVSWTLRFLDLNLNDFFFWCHQKSLVHQTSVAMVEDLTAQIVVASADIDSITDLIEDVRQSLIHRCWLCYDLRRRNFEQSLRPSIVVAFLTSSCDALFVS
ncbi:transposable element Tcb1 transposase [Trichonephila clavipes]|nr:transposable element Tcb1 transposase [Trichonephila clavipes]